MPDGAKWQIVFYSKKTGTISRKRGYKSKRDADAALLGNGFLPHGEVWTAEGWFAKVREDKNERLQGI